MKGQKDFSPSEKFLREDLEEQFFLCKCGHGDFQHTRGIGDCSDYCGCREFVQKEIVLVIEIEKESIRSLKSFNDLMQSINVGRGSGWWWREWELYLGIYS